MSKKGIKERQREREQEWGMADLEDEVALLRSYTHMVKESKCCSQ